jgi:hypothetical protein
MLEQREQRVERGLGAMLICVLALALLSPDPAAPAAPELRAVQERAATLQWEPPREGCGARCAYELSFRRCAQGETDAWWGRAEGTAGEPEWLATAEVSYRPGAAYFSQTVRLGADTAYRFRVRHRVPAGDWGPYSSESLIVRTLAAAGSGHGAGKLHPRTAVAAAATGGALAALDAEPAAGAAAPGRAAERPQPLRTFVVAGVVALLLFRSEASKRVAAALDRALSLRKSRVSQLGTLACVAIARQDWWSGAAAAAARVLWLVGSLSAVLVGAVLLQLLWWHCLRLDWPLVSRGSSFSAAAALLSALHVRLALAPLRRRVPEPWLPAALFSSWLAATVALLSLLLALERVTGRRKGADGLFVRGGPDR